MFWNNKKPAGSETRSLQVVGGKDTIPPPINPGAGRFIPKCDRESIVHAFYGLDKSMYWLARSNRLRFRDVEAILRDAYRDRCARMSVIEGLTGRAA